MAIEKRLIDAHDLWSDIMMLPHNGDMISSEEVEQTIMEAPTVDAVEVVHGRWVPTYHTYYNKDGASEIADELHCSECGIYSRIESNYCPNCGAKMDGDGNG